VYAELDKPGWAPPASAFGPVENMKLPAKERASMALVCRLS
jgi:hypothetical protein